MFRTGRQGKDRKAIALVLMGFLLVLTGCQIVDPPETPGSSHYNTFSASLPKWSEFSPPAIPSNEPTGDTSRFTEVVDGTALKCATRQYTLEDNPRQLVTMDPNVDALWVGSLLQGKHYLKGIGSLAELPIRQRAPVEIYIDVLGREVNRTIEDPNPARVQQNIADLVLELDASGVPFATDVNFLEATSYSMEQAALQLGMSAKFLGARVRTSLSTSSRVDRHTLLVSFQQKLFTVSMVSPQEPGGFFSQEFTEGALEEQIRLGRIGDDNLPVYVASITYGRMINFSFTSTASVDEMRATLDASFKSVGSGVETNLTFEQRKILEEAEIGLVAIGGPQELALSAIRTGDYREFFSEAVPLSTAVPISYQINNVTDNTPASFGETTVYNVTECGPTHETQEVQVVGSHCSAKSNWLGNSNSCTTSVVKKTLEAGAYWDEAKTKVVKVQQNGSTACYIQFQDYFEEESGLSVPRTVAIWGTATSPGCGNCGGNIQCRADGVAYVPTDPAPDPTPTALPDQVPGASISMSPGPKAQLGWSPS